MTLLNEIPIPTQGPFLLYDSNSAPFSLTSLSPFALTDAFIEYSVTVKQPILHFWSTDPLVLLGMMDTKLPFFEPALSVLSDAQYDYIVRNSGGLAVVSDPGVLNLSLIFPEEEHRISIDEGYRRMHYLIEQAFKDYGKTINAIEIADSYCPGEYDLSVDGRKIAGIAQRRIKGGIAIMIYLSVNGDQAKRGELIRKFYQKGLAGTKTKWNFPTVNPSSMTTLEEAFAAPFTISQVKHSITLALQKMNNAQLSAGIYTELIQQSYFIGMEKMKKRNEKLL
ncbi:octanoyl-[GcvH]:protein N-octanoyltransferase [Marinilactibacillus piezotolerans]|uniref:Octanoyl-[GcvH]:protein N-octanoyltransferase n=1 Tax=Marinilactibacillus piezotolerans TaxID=258723 RepID=A0A1I3Z7C0_9LACT|nr:lipoate--protein ligase family protein [Marinilactibacillus piezotolerans]SFK39945.1 octanoyl-[GcvH]:protein N-octanoyltransferase [Marinilactibacillus piezotolerans]